MTNNKPIEKIKTGVRNLDEILHGGIPKRSAVVFAGTPGSGKTILSQQIGFANATPETPVIFFQTLCEPTAKSLSFVSQFSFYDAEKIGKSVHFIDLGDIMRSRGIGQGIELLLENIKKIKPALVVIDSFKAFDDLAQSPEELRKFTYKVAIHLMAWECTGLLLGEFGKDDLEGSPLFSIIDGIIIASQRLESGEQQRYLQVVKMRGTSHSREEHTLMISDQGIDVFAPKVTIQRIPQADIEDETVSRLKTGVQALDHLIEGGIPLGSSCLISGISGTGKSLLTLEFLYRGAKEFNEKGILFLFEETKERMLAVGRKMQWDLQEQINKGMIEIIYIPVTSIQVEMHLLMMHEKIMSMEAKRVVVDSTSVFLHKVKDIHIIREKIYQLATIVQNAHAVGLFVTDIPSGTNKMSRYCVEETVVDGVILLSSVELDSRRERYLEVYKMRNTIHAEGKYKMKISSDGMIVHASDVVE
jgi:circadian clock protein KaiC